MPAAKREDTDDRGTGRWWNGPLAAAVTAVFIASVLLRLPACHESFWVDELHSAWTVWDGINQVPPRSAAGNQTPFYFFGLWLWKQIAGESEVALRLSSVLAMSIAAAVLVVAVSRTTGQLIAGIIAGGLLAVDSNAIFFGTELRPYAVVVLCAAVAIALFGSILHRLSDSGCQGESNMPSPRRDSPPGTVARRWLWLVGVVCIAALIQPTSAGALMPLAGLAAAIIVWRGTASGERISGVHWLVAGGLVVAAGFALTQSAAADAWSERDNWKAFASSHHWRQMWSVWPWGPLVIWPAIPALAWAICCGRRFPPARSAWPWLLVLVIGITVATWFAARVGWFPLWHRRYMISVLPMLAWVGGVFWAKVADALLMKTEPTRSSSAHVKPNRNDGHRLGEFLVQTAVVAVALTLLAWNQSTVEHLLARDPVLVRRHEGWREAVKWVDARRQPDDLVWLAAGLIESQELLRRNRVEPLPPDRCEYLNYAVGGPYSLSGARPIGPVQESIASNLRGLARGEDDIADTGRSLWILARFPAEKLEAILKEIEISRSHQGMGKVVQGRKLASFGGVTVVQIRLADSSTP